MATGRQRKKPRYPKQIEPRLSQEEADDLALAEELLQPPSPEERAAIEAEMDKFIKFLGLEGRKAIGAKKLRELAMQEGLDLEGNEFSRGIIEMREE
jgi:hypothetical protein